MADLFEVAQVIAEALSRHHDRTALNAKHGCNAVAAGVALARFFVEVVEDCTRNATLADSKAVNERQRHVGKKQVVLADEGHAMTPRLGSGGPDEWLHMPPS